MSPTNVADNQYVNSADDPQDLAARLVPLLREYTQRFWDLGESFGKTARRPDFDDLRFNVNRLKPAADDLSRQASQLVTHGKIEPVARIELSLRLADFESAVRYAVRKMNAVTSASG
jgi:hypothetical protein